MVGTVAWSTCALQMVFSAFFNTMKATQNYQFLIPGGFDHIILGSRKMGSVF